MTDSPGTVIVGAGHAGSQCAVSLRQAGYSGKITLLDQESFELPYHKPPLSKTFLQDIETLAKSLRPQSAYEKAGVDRLNLQVNAIDRQQKSIQSANGTSIGYDNLVLALGANNRELPQLRGIPNVHSIRTLADAAELRRQLADAKAIIILGGGFIGLETAACLATMNKSVTVIEGADRVLSRVCSPTVSKRVEGALVSNGIDLYTQQLVDEFIFHDGRVIGASLTTGESIPCDLLLVGIGAIANTQLAQDAGIDCNDGITVSADLRTSDPSIFAIGDCARFQHWQTGRNERLESVQNAVDQAKFVAMSIAQKSQDHYQLVPWFWSDIGSMKLQIAGLNTGNNEQIERVGSGTLAVYHLNDQQVVCVESINSAQDHLIARKLIGTDVKVSVEDVLQGPAHLKTLLL